MSGAVLILLFAWVLADLIGELGTGEYLASVVEALAMPAVWLVPALFVVAGIIAFATGTSWGSFGILLPLAGGCLYRFCQAA
ncbi:MAG TPA: Na+/H+ antiporter NhaC family protein [Beutenbergiaceae bacterium]|nr:Na+/H+ antiporter NhaC family protein [Beutenbergiaceae bacterium]